MRCREEKKQQIMKNNALKGFLIGVAFCLSILCIMGLGSQALANKQDLQEVHCKHFIYGIPLGTAASNDLIIRDIYALSSNDSTKFADWVAYRLDPETVVGDVETKRVWKADPWLAEEETLEPEDYKGAHKALKTDRGHQAPLASFKGTDYWHETNYLSNITPQKSDLDQGPWRILEEKVRSFVKAGNVVYVLTNTFYEEEMSELPGAGEDHRLPSGYWKIIIYQARQSDPNTLKTAAFIFPQQTPRKAAISGYQVPVDEIEKRSGLDVLWELADDLEGEIEGALDPAWAMEHFH
jgi:endonuclease G